MANGAPDVVRTYPSLAVKVIAGLFSAVALGGGVWAAHVTSEVNAVKSEHDAIKQREADSKVAIGVLREQAVNNGEVLKEVKENQRELNRKLDDILRLLPRR